MAETIITELSRIESLLKDLQNSSDGKYGELYKEWNVQEIVDKFIEKFGHLQNQSNNVQEKISKTYTKIYIFGSVSSGKSRLINGILGEDLFVSATEHTTKCFVHIMKSPDDKYKIIHGSEEFIYESKEDAMEKLDSISTYNNENSPLNVESVKVYIPISSDNKILKANVQLTDSPGTGSTDERTGCIQQYLSDADIVIYLLCHDITEMDERFFNIQADNTTKPDIYILVNKWDQSDQDRKSRLGEVDNT